MNINKLNKYIEYATTKIKLLTKERRYFSQGYRVKYMLEQNDSDVLVIVFSGCTRVGIKARYNYNRSLQKIKVNKLFILDDFGYDNRGAYYLGHNMDFKIQEVVKELIGKVQRDLNIKKSIYVGSSKGGYAALFFGLQEKESIVISGAPQYTLGNYLTNPEYKEPCLKYIVGNEITDEKINYLNDLLLNKIIECKDNNNQLNLHFSDKEHTYVLHIERLLSDLNSNNYKYNLDVSSYTNHNDVSLFFPKYLVKTINDLIS